MKVSILGLGTWAMGGDEWGPSDDEQSLEVLRHSVEAGITLIDCADVYGLGHSEELVGQTVSADSGVIVLTKGGWDIYTDPPVVGGARRRYDLSYIQHAFAESCRRLRRDRLDVYLLHNPTRADLEDGEGLRALRELQESRRVNWIGASVGSEEDARSAVEADVDVLEIPLNVIRNWARHILPEAAKRGIGVIAREPLERGLLTAKYGSDAKFPPGDHRAEKGRDWLLAAQPHIERLRKIAERRKRPPAEVAIAYPLSFPEVATTIAGARSTEQLDANMVGASTVLSDAEHSELETS